MVYRFHDGGTEVVLAHRRSPSVWALPKGTPADDETLEETAIRETREETGLDVEVVAPIEAIHYFFVRGSVRFRKTVHFFLMRAVGGDPERHDHEFDEVRWLPLAEAIGLLTYPTERGVVERAAEMIEGRKVATA